ncbi:MAG TPA: MlaD family protein [Rhodanobacteraceae bacterium]|jgi:phospholipid/cholesterol/gamma-HCH transport system substrate-binding protein|nr:MlaD family protein [Rhodanobacteraceae bacterium]
METRASYVLIGAFTLLVFLSAFFFVLWIGKLSLDREYDYYDVVFQEAVTGLTVGGAVQYNGVQVGEVRKLSLAPNDPRQAIAHIRLNGDTPIKTDTRAKLALLGMTGVAIIQLSDGTPGAPRLAAKSGETVPRIVADESAFQSLMSSGQDVALSANEVLLRVSRMLTEENMQHVANTLEHIDQVTATLADQRTELHTLITQLGAASSQLRGTLNKIDTLTVSADRLVNEQGRQLISSANAWLDSAQRATDNANAILEQNRAPIASFSSDGLAQIGPTLAELRATLQSLREVTTRLQNDPAAYLLGHEQPREFVPQ